MMNPNEKNIPDNKTVAPAGRTEGKKDGRNAGGKPEESSRKNAEKGREKKADKGPGKFRIIRFIMYILCIMLLLDGVLILLRNAVNASFIRNYENGSVSRMPEAALLYLRYGEYYVVPYNVGNVEYLLGDYEKAISYYQDALKAHPPEEEKECRIRVNLALSMCHTIDFDRLDYSDDEAVSEAIEVLMSARKVLTEHGCASEPVGSNDGHFADADSLKHDIDDMLEKLQKQSQSEDQQEQDDQQDQQEQDDQQEQQEQKDQQSSEKQKDEDEQKRQDELKEQLEKQKKALDSGSDQSGDNGFTYIEGGEARGFGDGTQW